MLSRPLILENVKTKAEKVPQNVLPFYYPPSPYKISRVKHKSAKTSLDLGKPLPPLGPNGWPLFMTDRFFDGPSDRFLDGQIFGRTVSKKVFNGLSK